MYSSILMTYLGKYSTNQIMFPTDVFINIDDVCQVQGIQNERSESIFSNSLLALCFDIYFKTCKQTRKALYNCRCIETSYALQDRHVTYRVFKSRIFSCCVLSLFKRNAFHPTLTNFFNEKLQLLCGTFVLKIITN